MNRQVEKTSRRYSTKEDSLPSFRDISAVKFYKTKRVISNDQNAQEATKIYNPQNYLVSCQQLSDQQLNRQYKTNPFFKSRIRKFYEKNQKQIKAFRKIPQDTDQNKVLRVNNEQRTVIKLRREQNQKLKDFYFRCIRLFQRLDIKL